MKVTVKVYSDIHGNGISNLLGIRGKSPSDQITSFQQPPPPGGHVYCKILLSHWFSNHIRIPRFIIISTIYMRGCSTKKKTRWTTLFLLGFYNRENYRLTRDAMTRLPRFLQLYNGHANEYSKIKIWSIRVYKST